MSVKKQLKGYISFGFVVVFCLALMIFMAMFSSSYIEKRTGELAADSFNATMQKQAQTIQLKFDSDRNMLLVAASMFTLADSLEDFEHYADEFEFLKESFEYIAVATPDGGAIGLDGSITDISERDYFKRSMQGETAISKLIVSGFNSEYSVVISTPIKEGNDIIGVMLGINSSHTLSRLFGDETMDVDFSSVISSDGEIIINGMSDTSTDIVAQNIFEIVGDDVSREELSVLKAKVIGDEQGYVEQEFSQGLYYVSYVPLEIEDWVLLSINSQNSINSITQDIANVTGVISLIGLSILIILSVVIYFNNRVNLKAVQEVAFISELTRLSTAQKFKIDAPSFMKKHADQKMLLIKFDVDNFKLVNESLGIQSGDMVLKSMAKAMGEEQPHRMCAHLHDDEFVVLLTESDPDYGNMAYKNYTRRLFKILGDDFNYKLKIVAGLYYFESNEKITVIEALERANIAHRRAKTTHNEIGYYSEELISQAMKRKNIENNMETALKNKEFVMVLQPELSLEKGTMVAAEALVRWQSKEGPLRPDEFIPIFEQNGFITKLDMCMFEQACEYLSSWIKDGRAPITISINFSRLHLLNEHFVDNLNRITEKYGVSPKNFGIEITETNMLNNEEAFLRVMNSLHESGYIVLMDDFGSGYSSLGLLKNAAVDILKLDRSFLTGADDRRRSMAVVRSVISLSIELGIKTIAEGVETLEDSIILKEMGCDIIQGYYYAKPMSQEAIKRFYDSKESVMTF